MITIQDNLPTPSDYLSLMAETGWDMPNLRLAKAALAASLCGAVAIQDGQTIGMVRAVGDGVMKVYIQDMIVTQAKRRTGLGNTLMNAILSQLATSCPPNCMIGLFAADGQSPFYSQLGFTSRPSVGFGPGMHGTLSELATARGAA